MTIKVSRSLTKVLLDCDTCDKLEAIKYGWYIVILNKNNQELCVLPTARGKKLKPFSFVIESDAMSIPGTVSGIVKRTGTAKFYKVKNINHPRWVITGTIAGLDKSFPSYDSMVILCPNLYRSSTFYIDQLKFKGI